MVNLSLRGIQFLFALAVNFILVQFVADDEAEAIAVTLIMIALNIQVLFGSIGTYILNRINSSRKGMSTIDPQPFLYLIFILSILAFIYFIFTEENWYFSILLVALAQGNFQLLNSIYGVRVSIQRSLVLANIVYLIFLLFILIFALLSTLTAKIWLSSFALANILGTYSVITAVFKSKKLDIYLAKDFIFQKSIYVHGTGHVILTMISWFCFLYIRTLFAESETLNYVDFLKVGILISLLIGAAELLFNTVFLTKVLRNPDNIPGFIRYSDSLCLMLVSMNILLIAAFPFLGKYYFEVDTTTLRTAFGILLCVENTKIIFNIVINNSARQFEYSKTIIASLVLVLTTSLISIFNETFYIGIILFAMTIITSSIVLKQGSLSLHGVLSFISLNVFILSYFQILSDPSYMGVLIILGILNVGFAIKIFYNVKAPDLVREFIKYD